MTSARSAIGNTRRQIFFWSDTFEVHFKDLAQDLISLARNLHSRISGPPG